MLEVILTLFAVFALAWPLGRYLAVALGDAPSRVDRVFGPLERLFYKLCGIDPTRGMSWRGIAMAFVVSNVVLAAIVQAILMFQHLLPLNPDGIPGMSWDLALHTMVSFLTNTNQQHYSGQAQLSYFAQLAGIVTLQIVTPAMGLAIGLAVLRGLFGGRNAAAAKEGEIRDLGNFYVDTTRSVLRVFLPLMLVWSLLLTWQGVPSTLAGAQVATPVDASAEMKEQVIPVGPVAPMVAIKQLGTNGGGWYGPNSAVPLENPTPLSNLFEMIAILLVPVALVFMIGRFTGRPRLTWLTLRRDGRVLARLHRRRGLVGSAAECRRHRPGRRRPEHGRQGAALRSGRVGAVGDHHHADLERLGQRDARFAQPGCRPGGDVGHADQHGLGRRRLRPGRLHRLPAGDGIPVRTDDRAHAGDLRTQDRSRRDPPAVAAGVAAADAAARRDRGDPVVAAIHGNSNPGFHGVSQVFYEYASAYANNGSGFEGLGDATPWWNLTCVVVLLFGRYACLIIPLVVAGRLAAKRVAPVSPGTLNIETPTFGVTLIAVIVLVTLLCFLPVLALGPIGEALSLAVSS